MMAKYNWTRQETKDLITLYEINECLWNKNLREYKDRDERISSIQSISDEMKISIDEINKKIHNLRNQYRFELNKMKKKILGKPRYVTKWPYYQNLSFLENIVSVRGSSNNNSQTNGDYSDTNEYKTVEKYEEENENSAEHFSNNNESTTIVATNANPAQPQQIFHVSVEYEEPKPKTKPEPAQNGRKRRMQIAKDAAIDVSQPQLLNSYINQIQPSSSSTPKQAPTIIIDDKSQDQDLSKNGSVSDVDEPAAKAMKIDDATQKPDKYEIFGMFIAEEMRSLHSTLLQNKLKRKILECVLGMSDQDGEKH